MGENPVSAFVKYYNESSELSDEELMIITSWLSANSWQYRNSFKLYELGIISEEDWLSELSLLAGYYATPIGRSYWNATKVYYRPAYVEAVEPAIFATELTGVSWMNSLRNGANSLSD